MKIQGPMQNERDEAFLAALAECSGGEESDDEDTVVLDLHGYSVWEAVELAEETIRKAWERGCRYVQLIHGAPDIRHWKIASVLGRGAIKWTLRGFLARGDWNELVYGRRSRRHQIDDGSMILESVPKGGDSHRIGYETQALSERSYRRAMGASGAPHPSGPAGGPSPQDGPARGCQRPVLPRPRGLRLAGVAPRLPAVEDRLQLLPVVDLGRHLAEHPRRLARAGPYQGRARADAERRSHRQPVGQDGRGGKGARHRRRQEGQGPQAAYPCGYAGPADRRGGDGRERGRRPGGPGRLRPGARPGFPAAGSGLRRRQVSQLRPV